MSKVLLDTNVVLRLLAETDPRHDLASGAVADAFEEWWRIVAAGVSGKRAHDARMAALMKVHGIEYVLTFNRDDFAGFDGVKTIVPGTAMPA